MLLLMLEGNPIRFISCVIHTWVVIRSMVSQLMLMLMVVIKIAAENEKVVIWTTQT